MAQIFPGRLTINNASTLDFAQYANSNGSVMDSFTVVPIQIFTWATRPQAGYETIAAVAIVVLLVILLVLNGTAIYLRNRFQLRW